MPRLDETILKSSVSEEHQAPMLDVSKGGQSGYQIDIAGYVSQTGYTPAPLIPLLMEPPRGFYHLAEPGKLVGILKGLIETQSKNITGLISGVTVERNERQISRAGHVVRDPTKVVETQPTPTHVYDERSNKSIHKFTRYYIENLIGDTITQQPGVVPNGVSLPTDYLADFYSFTNLYIEPDRLRTSVVDAWLITDLYPGGSGDLEAIYDLTAGGDVPEITWELGGLAQSNLGVRLYAQSLLDKVNYAHAGPMHRPAFLSKVHADVAAGSTAEAGYMEGISRAQSAAVR